VIAFWHGRAVSENQRLAPGQGRFCANESYQAFKESLIWQIRPYAEQFPGPVAVRITMILNSRIDASNIIKPVLDALQAAGVVKNDKLVQKMQWTRENAKPKQDDWLCITVTEA